ncbi:MULTISPECIES: hypothetical protein [unclassified Clostridioides]|uniref:hypothetical protein n=1 Tax=unclassified Clostridioides TaxID=2635829 RepID=UPI001D129145|nr:hypothetical protein [Clostridioides sp. ES-W-0018-02]MCC0705008.1 hypothetical protein [Clostridioides sp. ES-S-0049-02]MCC0713060.1 hypothetical protein [Clostridioides sp. ES-W-0017-02]
MNKMLIFHDEEGHPVFQVLVTNVKKYTRQNVIFGLVDSFIKKNVNNINLNDGKIYDSFSWAVFTISKTRSYKLKLNLTVDYNVLIKKLDIKRSKRESNSKTEKELFYIGIGWFKRKEIYNLLTTQNKIKYEEYDILTIDEDIYIRAYNEKCRTILFYNNYQKILKEV